MNRLEVVKIRSRESSPVQSYSAAKRVQVFLGLVPAGCLIIWEVGGCEGVYVWWVDLRWGCWYGRSSKGQSWVHINSTLDIQHKTPKRRCMSRKVWWGVHQKEEIIFSWCAFFSLPIFKGRARWHIWLGESCEMWILDNSRAVSWRVQSEALRSRCPQSMSACHCVHSKWRDQTSYLLGLGVCYSHLIILVSLCSRLVWSSRGEW